MATKADSTLNVAIIPARGGSKRIPRKNIRSFNGLPMISYPIRAALESGVFDKVVVSTDDQEIAAIASDFGAEVPFIRDPALADDHTGTGAVMQDAILQLQRSGWHIGVCACIYATTPLLNSERIKQVFQTFSQTTIDFVFTAAAFSFPIQRALLKLPNGGVEAFDKQSIGKRSQDLPPAFHDAGQLYMANAATWLDSSKGTFSAHSRMYVLPSHLVQDIDNEEDWHRAELLYRMLQESGEC